MQMYEINNKLFATYALRWAKS